MNPAKGPQKAKKIGGNKNLPPPSFDFIPAKSDFPKFKLRNYSFTKVTAPSEAEETSEAYLEKTPRL